MNTIPWWYTEISEGEKKKILEAFEAKHFTLGPVTETLEKQIASTLDIPYVVVTPSGTAALTMALMAVGVGPGDEVIVPDLTWIATAQAAAILGARIILVDCLSDCPLIDPAQVKAKISSRAKAIIPVHLNGRPCPMKELLDIARRQGIAVIEDACKAFASRDQEGYLGTLGDMGCFSLGMVALISCGYGGVVVTRHKKYYDRLKLIQTHGVLRRPEKKQVEEAYKTMGFNFKYSDILAAIGIAQLSRLREKLAQLYRIYQCYQKGLSRLPYIDLIPVDIRAGQVPLCVEARSKFRNRLISYLESHQVEALAFHPPLHSATYLRNPGGFPYASRFAREGLILPCGPSQPLENVERCIELLQKWERHFYGKRNHCHYSCL